MTAAADAFYRTVFDSPGGPESLAPRLGISAQLLRNKANPNIATNQPYLSDIEKVMTLTGDVSVLHALAKGQNYVCIPVETDCNASDMAVIEFITKVWSRSGDVGAEVNKTLEDGRVETHEIERVADAIYRTNEALQQMLSRLRGMAEK